MTRAVPMDELLLQLAESLRKTMRLDAAEIYTGASDVLEADGVGPGRGPKPTRADRPRAAGRGSGRRVGERMAAVWVPALVDGGEYVAARSADHPLGDLLGLIVAERAARAITFTDEYDRVLTELARQVGLAFHNFQLDSALQTTLDALRKQATTSCANPASRIVATWTPTPPHRTRPARRRPAAPGGAGHQPPSGPRPRGRRPEMVGEMLEELRGDVQPTINELRELAHGIYPPLLRDNGFADALAAAANRNLLTVEVTVADDIDRYPAEVEAAIYFSLPRSAAECGEARGRRTVAVTMTTERRPRRSASRRRCGVRSRGRRCGHGFVNMATASVPSAGRCAGDSKPGHGAAVNGSVPLAA